MKFDQKIAKANHVQLDVSTPIQEMITLKRDTIGLLEPQSAPWQQFFDGSSTKEILTVPEAGTPSWYMHPGHNHPIRQGRATPSHLQPEISFDRKNMQSGATKAQVSANQATIKSIS